MPAPGYTHPSKKKLTPDQMVAYQQIASVGSQAGVILGQIGPKLDKRREQVIGEALSYYRGVQMTEPMALRYWAILSEVAALKEQLCNEQDAGIQAYAELMQQTEGNENE
jgi:hypothetical protein